MYRSSPFRSTWNTGYTLQVGHVSSIYRSSPFRSTWNHGLHYRFGHVSSIYRSSPFRSTWNTGYITGLDMCPVCTEAVHSVALGTRVTLQVWDMRPVCTEAVHSVALGTRVIHYRFGHVSSIYRSSPFRSTWNTGYITGLDMCPVCTEAVHSVALGTRVTLQVWTCVKYIPKQSIP